MTRKAIHKDKEDLILHRANNLHKMFGVPMVSALKIFRNIEVENEGKTNNRQRV